VHPERRSSRGSVQNWTAHGRFECNRERFFAGWSREVAATTPATPVPFSVHSPRCAVCLRSWQWPAADSSLASASPPGDVGATPVVVYRDFPAWAPRYEERYLPASASICAGHQSGRANWQGLAGGEFCGYEGANCCNPYKTYFLCYFVQSATPAPIQIPKLVVTGAIQVSRSILPLFAGGSRRTRFLLDHSNSQACQAAGENS